MTSPSDIRSQKKHEEKTLRPFFWKCSPRSRKLSVWHPGIAVARQVMQRHVKRCVRRVSWLWKRCRHGGVTAIDSKWLRDELTDHLIYLMNVSLAFFGFSKVFLLKFNGHLCMEICCIQRKSSYLLKHHRIRVVLSRKRRGLPRSKFESLPEHISTGSYMYPLVNNICWMLSTRFLPDSLFRDFTCNPNSPWWYFSHPNVKYISGQNQLSFQLQEMYL